ncbi:hypothetical protein [Spirillospora sp. NBC_01491]|uniref:hypothetical protein n=1 Tax=Spirillospora sp. NBC_01491 TaxID=2976007 RepID=UPI002E35CBBF|nr:hypothetical protein [Spirillospora sp. NBC_01491]
MRRRSGRAAPPWQRARVDLEGFGRPWLLFRGRGPDRVVMPLPADEAEHVQLLIESDCTWSAWLQAADTAPILQKRISSKGSFVFRHVGEPRQVSMQHNGRGAFSLTGLTLEFGQGERVLSGMGNSSAKGHLEGSTFVHVHADGDWTVTLL